MLTFQPCGLPRLSLNPFASNDSASTTSSKNVTATGQGKAVNDAVNTTQVGDSSIGVGAAGKYIEGGGLDLSGVSGKVSINDPKQLTALAEDFANTTKSIASEASAANLASNNAFLNGLNALAMSQQTGGLTPVMKTFLWLGLGAIALLAVIFRRK